jgi:hypothetical protein
VLFLLALRDFIFKSFYCLAHKRQRLKIKIAIPFSTTPKQ